MVRLSVREAAVRRHLIWAWLVVKPGSTGRETCRGALGRRGNDVYDLTSLLRAMESEGLVTSERAYTEQRGYEATLWYGVPGAIEDGEEDDA